MRRKFGGSGADQVIDGQGNFVPFAVGSAFTSQSAGLPITDLQTYAATPISVITADSTGLPEWLGPDDGTAVMWVDFGFGRRLHRAVDTEDRVGALEATLGTGTGTVAANSVTVNTSGGLAGPSAQTALDRLEDRISALETFN